jgi:RecA-family ATPase
MDPIAEPVPDTWVTDGVIMEHKINLMFGPEKAGKSRLLAWYLVHAFYELSLWGRPTQHPGKILYLCGEETDTTVGQRLIGYTKVLGLDMNEINWGRDVTFMAAAGMRLDKPEQRAWLRSELLAYDTIVIDPLRRVHAAKESSNDEMAKILNDFREWSNSLALTMIVLHHTGKIGPDDDEDRIATWSRGATDLPAILDWATYTTRQIGHGVRPDRVRIRSRGRAESWPDVYVDDLGDDSGWRYIRG